MTTSRHLSTRRGILAAGAALAFGAPGARAQDAWPTRPIRMIVPSGPGSGADLMCRVFSDWLAQGVRQPVVVDNKPGANGVLAAETLVKSPPDGYTLAWMSSSSTVIAQALQPRPGFDAVADMQPMVQVGAGGIHLVVAPDFPAQNLRELLTLLKARPGAYNYASWGAGSTGHLVMEWLKSQTGVDVRHIPYKTMPQIYQDMQGGIVPIAWVDASSSVALIKAGKLRALATSASTRGPALPELPTLTEQGYRFESDAWYGVFGPRGTPAGVVNTVNRVIREGLVAPSLRSRLVALNLGDTPPRTPDDFARLVRHDQQVWREIVRVNNIKVE